MLVWTIVKYTCMFIDSFAFMVNIYELLIHRRLWHKEDYTEVVVRSSYNVIHIMSLTHAHHNLMAVLSPGSPFNCNRCLGHRCGATSREENSDRCL